MTKTCVLCKAEKSITDFGFNKKIKDGLHYYCRACVSIYDKKQRAKDPEKTKIKARQRKSTIDGRYASYKADAKKRDIVFELTKDDFQSLWQKPCHYCDSPIETIGIDRKDNNVGYILDNCLSCCKYCNNGKNNSTYEEFIERCKRIAEKWS